MKKVIFLAIALVIFSAFGLWSRFNGSNYGMHSLRYTVSDISYLIIGGYIIYHFLWKKQKTK